MKALHDPQMLLAEGLTRIREEFAVPGGFPAPVQAAADAAAQRRPGAHADRTALPFVTLDPAESTDLDQAFAIEAAGADWLLHYAIADVPWFVGDGDAIDAEAWARGTTSYLPDGKAGLYPASLSEGAASLLPDGDRPAIILTTRIDPAGEARLDGAERALIRSRAKLAYETVREADLPPGFADLAARIGRAEDRRGAARVDPPEQQLEPNGTGGFTLAFRPLLLSETRNAALSLAANLAVARTMLDAGTGLFRVMAAPDAAAEAGLRATAQAFGLRWPAEMPLAQFERRLDGTRPAEAAFMLAVRRAGRGATYRPYTPRELPWHAALAAPYAHATAPLRRLADRYVLRAVLAIANGQPVPQDVSATFERLPKVMARAANRDGQIERAVIDLAETAMLANFVGRDFAATITDVNQGQARIQLADLPIVATVPANHDVPGDTIRVRLASASPAQRRLEFERLT
ncbi:RNB domain-containing ribonuclease [Novosphingobium album (ex Liu et al. 2023)]|nr:RNB domain-containing ribonuclease [Novosphingobium album (ex Liu et al. 2023)]